MLNLITALTNGTVEYKDDGVEITHPPTATMLRAARTLKELATINEQNQHILNQLQLRVNQLEAENESLRQAQWQASNMGSGNH